MVARDRGAALDPVGVQAVVRAARARAGSTSCALAESRRGAVDAREQTARERFWRGFFLAIDGLIKEIEELGLVPFRARALDRAERWMVERLQGSDGLGAIFPSIMNTVLALVCRGRGVDDPLVRSQLRELEKLEIADGDELRLQPCLSPVWDTSLALNSLLESGVSPVTIRRSSAARAGCSTRGAAARRLEAQEPGRRAGRLVLRVRQRVLPRQRRHRRGAGAARPHPAPRRRVGERRRGGARSRSRLAALDAVEDGGWAAFDKDCDRRILELVPFADHNAMLDPATVDITSRTIEALIGMGHQPTHPAIRRAVAFLWKEQEAEGCWYGRWGVNYIYGTWLALTALRDVGEDLRSPGVRRARGVAALVSERGRRLGRVAPVLRRSEPEGPRRDHGVADGVGVLGLIAAGALDDPRGAAAVRRGIDWLLATQRERRQLVRRALDRHRLPQGVLPALPPVRLLLPAPGAGRLRCAPWSYNVGRPGRLARLTARSAPARRRSPCAIPST